MDYTVIITTIPSRQDLLMRSLTSVMQQSLPAREVIVVCDRTSLQHSLATLRDISIQYLQQNLNNINSINAGELLSKIKFIESDSKGISSARNSGINAATSKWLAFLDDDDEWLTEKMFQQAKIIEEANGADMSSIATMPKYSICHTMEKWLRKGQHIKQMAKHQPSGGKIYLKSIQLCSMAPSSVVIHREIFNRYGMFDERMSVCEDFDMWLRITAYEEVLLAKQSLVIKHDGHANQLSHLYWGMDRFRIYALQKMLREQNLTTEYREATEHSINQRLSILAEGARKRNKQSHSLYYSAIKTDSNSRLNNSGRQIYLPSVR